MILPPRAGKAGRRARARPRPARRPPFHPAVQGGRGGAATDGGGKRDTRRARAAPLQLAECLDWLVSLESWEGAMEKMRDDYSKGTVAMHKPLFKLGSVTG